MNELAINIWLTSTLCTATIVLIIKNHGDDEPRFSVMAAEAIGFAVSCAVWFISGLVVIWT